MKSNKCPVCSNLDIFFSHFGKDFLYQLSNKQLKLFKCNQCHAIFINPVPTETEVKKFYPKTYYSYQKKQKKGFFDKVKSLIIKFNLEKTKINLFEKILIIIFKPKFGGLPLYKKQNARFLDIGCGTGENLSILNQYDWKSFGIELDKEAVAIARKNNLNVKQSSLEKISFKEKFDCIRIWHVFEHLKNPNTSLKKIKSLLKKDGEILMAVPNSKSLAYKLFRQYWYNLDCPRHLINYCPETIAFLCKKHGLKITEIKFATVGFLLGGISNYLRSLNIQNNLINKLLLVLIFSPLDYLADMLKLGDVIFLKIRHSNQV
jgi:2-polyprenyl-3-methyl-5-hydroxy-6-metoxy-1,4-benzoquinol methylase